MEKKLLRPVEQAESKRFLQEGAVLLRGMLPAYWVDVVREGLDEIHDSPGDMTSRAVGNDGRGESVIDQFSSIRNKKLKQFVEESPAAEIAAKLLGSASVRFYIDQMFYKSAGRVLPTAWHQDTPYMRIAGNDLARIWVTCDPSPKETTVCVIKGSHLWNVVYRPVVATAEVREAEAGARFSYGSSADYDDRLPAIPDIDAHPGAFDVLRWDVEPGDVLVFNGNIVHGAGGVQMHSKKRRAFATVWAGDDVRYLKRPGLTLPDLSEFAGVEITDGSLLSDYPAVFPRAWPAEMLGSQSANRSA